jgi:hypothetical protein
MTYNQLAEIANQFNALETDMDRFKFIIEHKDLFTLYLDNDSTSVTFSDSAVDDLTGEQLEMLPKLNWLDDCLGNDGGVFSLCDAIGIKAEAV